MKVLRYENIMIACLMLTAAAPLKGVPLGAAASTVCTRTASSSICEVQQRRDLLQIYSTSTT